jgi:hypothetical protein
MDIERTLWISNKLISACCLFKRKSTYWFKWKYIKNT